MSRVDDVVEALASMTPQELMDVGFRLSNATLSPPRERSERPDSGPASETQQERMGLTKRWRRV